MPSFSSPLFHNQQTVINRFTSACQDDSRVVAAFLGGSHVTGTVDIYSDVDLYLITRDEDYEDFLAGRKAFVALLGEPLFLEDFGIPNCKFFVLSDGTEGELWIGSESGFDHIYSGPEKKGC